MLLPKIFLHNPTCSVDEPNVLVACRVGPFRSHMSNELIVRTTSHRDKQDAEEIVEVPANQ